MKKAGRKKNFHFGIFEVKKWKKVGKLRIGGYAAGLPVCGTAKTQRKRGLLRPRQINRASYTARKALPVYFYARPLALANPLPVATLLDSAGSSHRLTAPRYGLTSYCGRSLFTSEEDMRPSPQGLGKERDATHSAPRG